MKKYNVMGYEMVKVQDLRHTVRKLRRTVKERYNMFDAEKQAMIHLAYNDIVKQLYLEEFNKAKTPDEIRAVLEMPGDFVVYKKGEGKHDFSYVIGLGSSGKPVIGVNSDLALRFPYESEAKKVAKDIGEGWEVIDLTPGAYADEERLLKAIFGEEESYAEH